MDNRFHLSAGKEDTMRQTPWESVVFAYAGVAPIAAGALAVCLFTGPAAVTVAHLTVNFSGAILCFLAGVRRGLSFRQEEGPLLTQLVTMLWLFSLGFASIAISWTRTSLVLQIVGFATMAFYDPIAARKGEAPLYFQRLRPVQMMVPVVSLGLVWVRLALF